MTTHPVPKALHPLPIPTEWLLTQNEILTAQIERDYAYRRYQWWPLGVVRACCLEVRIIRAHLRARGYPVSLRENCFATVRIPRDTLPRQ